MSSEKSWGKGRIKELNYKMRERRRVGKKEGKRTSFPVKAKMFQTLLHWKAKLGNPIVSYCY